MFLGGIRNEELGMMNEELGVRNCFVDTTRQQVETHGSASSCLRFKV